MTRMRTWGILVGIAAFCLAWGCRKAVEEPKPAPATSQAPSAPALKGTLRVSGAWALYPMMVKWSEEFRKIHPDVRIDVSAGGAGKGAADALAGLVDIGMVSREIKQAEIDQGGVGLPVVKDAVFPTISSRNPVWAAGLQKKGLKKQVFVDLWMKATPVAWGELAGAEAKDQVKTYTRSDACGAAETWAKYLGGAQEDLKGVAVYGDPGLAEAVRNDPLGIGFNNLNFAYDPKGEQPLTGLQVVSIDVNENGVVDPEEDLSTKRQAIKAIQDGVYPSPPARDLNLLAKGRFQGLARDFVLWILGDGQKYVEETGYVTLPQSALEKAVASLAPLQAATPPQASPPPPVIPPLPTPPPPPPPPPPVPPSAGQP